MWSRRKTGDKERRAKRGSGKRCCRNCKDDKLEKERKLKRKEKERNEKRRSHRESLI